jgi:hypothetical protein
MSTYNGWSNYATWRVNLELIDGFRINADTPYEDYELAEYLKETAILAVENSCPDTGGIALDYALAFLDEVNWQEIAKHKQDELTPADWEQLARIAASLNQRKSA